MTIVGGCLGVSDLVDLVDASGDLCNTRGCLESRVAHLDRFNFVYVLIIMRIPDRGGIFQLRSHEIYMLLTFKVLVMYFDVTFQEAKSLICLFL